MDFKQETEIIVANKQTAFLLFYTRRNNKKFPQPKFKLISPMEGIEVSLRSYHEKSAGILSETSWTRDLFKAHSRTNIKVFYGRDGLWMFSQRKN